MTNERASYYSDRLEHERAGPEVTAHLVALAIDLEQEADGLQVIRAR
jgi:hypothetical protein